jgi:hypothetical protein
LRLPNRATDSAEPFYPKPCVPSSSNRARTVSGSVSFLRTIPRRAYEAVEFQAEGVARGSAFFAGAHRDELVMSILRPDWISMRRP